MEIVLKGDDQIKLIFLTANMALLPWLLKDIRELHLCDLAKIF